MLRLLTSECSHSVFPMSSVEATHSKSLSQILNGPEASQIVSTGYTGSKGNLHFLPELPWRVPGAWQDLGSWRPLERDLCARTEGSESLEMPWHVRGVSHRYRRRHWLPWSCSGGWRGYPRSPQMAWDAWTLLNRRGLAVCNDRRKRSNFGSDMLEGQASMKRVSMVWNCASLWDLMSYTLMLPVLCFNPCSGGLYQKCCRRCIRCCDWRRASSGQTASSHMRPGSSQDVACTPIVLLT